MKAIDAIRTALEMNETDIRLIEDMRDAPLTHPTPRGGNHPLWVLGHLAFSEGELRQVVLGEPNPLKHWAPQFGPGVEPRTDASAYPDFEEVLTAYRDQRDQTMRLLDEIGDDGLDQPPKDPPKGAEEFFPTVGQTFLTLASHNAFHCGQVADARRAAGRKPIFM